MSQPYVGEIRMFGGNFAPQGWALCSGQTMSISENDVLFNLIGTTYGGDGQTSFNLPNLQSRFPLHMGSNGTTTYNIADNGGVESVTLTTNQIPVHNHNPVLAANTSGSDSPSNNLWGNSNLGKPYVAATGVPNPVAMNTSTVQSQGGSQPHDNMQPFLCINFIIALYGVYPTQT